MYMKKMSKIISATVIATSLMWVCLYWVNASNDTSWSWTTENSTNMMSQYNQWKMMWKGKMWWGFERMNNMSASWGDMLTSFISFDTLTDTQKETVKSILDTHRKSMDEIRKAYTGSTLTDTQKEEIKTKIVSLHNDLITKLTEYVSADKLEAFKKAVENMGNIDMFLNNDHMNEKMSEKFEKMNSMSASWMVKNVDRKQEFQNKWKTISETNKYLTGKTYTSLKTKLVAMDVTQLKDIQSKIDVLVEKLSVDTKTNEKKIWTFKELRALIDTVLLEKEDNSDSILNEIIQ